jgi:hypothetical protein
VPDWNQVLSKCLSVKTGYRKHPTTTVLNQPESPERVALVQSTVGSRFVPEEYATFLLHSNGAFLLPWDEDGTAGVWLFGSEEVAEGNETAYATLAQPVRADEVPFFMVGRLTSASSDFIGVDESGTVWWLDYQSGLADWQRSIGCRVISKSLSSFVERLADEAGSWWWLKGFSSRLQT